MGTRHLIKVIDNKGELKVAQYGQWDGYPKGKGLRTLLYADYHLDKIEKGLKRVRWAEDNELDVIESQFPEANYFGTEDSDNFELLYPNLVRDTSADILMVIAYSIGEVILVNNIEFEEDELFCEGVYTLNYQTRTYTTKYHGVELIVMLDKLPDYEEYIKLWEERVEWHKQDIEYDKKEAQY